MHFNKIGAVFQIRGVDNDRLEFDLKTLPQLRNDVTCQKHTIYPTGNAKRIFLADYCLPFMCYARGLRQLIFSHIADCLGKLEL